MNAIFDLAAELDALARAVGRLRPDWRDATEFYELRSEIIGTLRRLARNGGAAPVSVPRVLVRERLVERVRVVVLPRHLARPGRRHRYPRPPPLPEQRTIGF